MIFCTFYSPPPTCIIDSYIVSLNYTNLLNIVQYILQHRPPSWFVATPKKCPAAPRKSSNIEHCIAMCWTMLSELWSQDYDAVAAGADITQDEIQSHY